ncbi:hypothetical protein OGAPHI_004836 [Ogataea philodendri]|uniref:RING-type domain-containing protein n=1 Tax=Ogataea philodendri TaxID=1378263 RepID=A0A9P8P3E2_9ASCO|nr:uncharacterized protein OGAPHI_004836 [Ogataea philodendri]KAH3664122.1 hypothetical protein OGAPHI_004836 [Ogataea philodendri]
MDSNTDMVDDSLVAQSLEDVHLTASDSPQERRGSSPRSVESTPPSTPNGYDITKELEDVPIDLRALVYISMPEHLNCPVCQLPFINPYTTICGHTFCKTCIMETIKSPLGSKCPLDRIELNYNDERPDSGETTFNDIFPAPIILSNITDDLQVRCLNEPRGCTWVGPRWQIKQHLVNNCEHTRFECDHEIDNKVCGKLTERRFLGFECPHQPLACDKCGEEVTLVTKDHHLMNECTKNLRKCLGCNLEFPEKVYESHEKYCEKIYIKCPGSQYGCEWRGSREVLHEIHTSECVFLKLSNYFEKQETKYTDLADENRMLRSQLSTILDSITQGKLTNLGYSLQLEEIMDNQSVEPFKLFDNLQEKDFIQLLMEFEVLKTDVNRLRSLVSERDLDKQLVTVLANDNVQIKDELDNHTVALTSIKQQIQFMLMDRRRLRSKFNSTESVIPSEQDSSSSTSNRFTNKL